jgi:O-antigen ligase
LSLPETCVVWLTVPLVVYPAWVWGGGTSYFSGVTLPLGALACLALAGLLLTPLLESGGPGARCRAALGRLGSLLRDPLLYTGAALVLLLGTHWLNAWWPTAEPEDWFAGVPRVRHLPAAVTAPEGRFMLLGVFNAWVLALCIRHGLATRRGLRRVYRYVLGAAFGLGCFGIVQYFSGTDSLYWVWERRRHFFASFAYENHAAQFFLMMLCLAAGYAAYLLCRRGVSIRRPLVVRLSALVGVLFLSTVFSLSRAGIVFAAVAVVAGALYVIRNLPPHVTTYAKLALVTGLAVVCICGLVLVSGAVGQDIREDFTQRHPGQTLLQHAHAVRAWQWQAALDMWRQRPLWGVGSFGFRYFVRFYAPAESLRALSGQSAGNVHNDWLHYLAELGLAGAALLAASLAALIAPVVTSRAWRREIVALPLMGAGMVLVHSLFDLPYRCPAVLAAWVLLVAGGGRYYRLSSGTDTMPIKGTGTA